jgi:hypothetical protein
MDPISFLLVSLFIFSLGYFIGEYFGAKIKADATSAALKLNVLLKLRIHLIEQYGDVLDDSLKLSWETLT